MSEILIKNMALPKQGWKRLILLPDGEVREICGDEAVSATDAKAVELPEHGDLKDENVIREGFKNYDDWFVEEAMGVIENAPTILEASE